MISIKNTRFILILSFLCSFYGCHKNDKNKWVKIFNGEDLSGWVVKIKGHPIGVNYKNTFIVEDGVLKINYNEYDTFDDSFGHIFYNKELSNYRIRLQYRFTEVQLEGAPEWATLNSGVMIHCEDPKNMAIDQQFPVCIEAQLMGGINQGEARATGNLCTPGSAALVDTTFITRPCFQSSSETFYGDQWVTFEAEVRNDSIIKHFINGENVLTYTKPHVDEGMPDNAAYWKTKIGTPLKKGFISLQSESHSMEFKNIEVLEY